jgi:glycosyltransferase involved in cell wall biosynthesis
MMFSVCIPTRNRADVLQYCLDNVEAMDDGMPFEIVVSDNASEDHTRDVVERFQAKSDRVVRYIRQPKDVGAEGNILSAYYHARGEFVVYLADDDSLIPETLAIHLERMQREKDIVSLYADWIAWDDNEGKELHRYFKVDGAVEFTPANPFDLAQFVLGNQIYPEVGIHRRKDILRSYCFVGCGVPHHLWMYRQSRRGRVVFDSRPYYREHRVLKYPLARAAWENMDRSSHYYGDEMRFTLGTLVQWAQRDSGGDVTNYGVVRDLIEKFLHRRLPLMASRAYAKGDFIGAAEMARQLMLWYKIRVLPPDAEAKAEKQAEQMARAICGGGSDHDFEGNYAI